MNYFVSQRDNRTIVSPNGDIVAVAKTPADAQTIVKALNR
jgi:hypothetical protein